MAMSDAELKRWRKKHKVRNVMAVVWTIFGIAAFWVLVGILNHLPQ